MQRQASRLIRAHAEVHARAGLIASEYSLIGLGATSQLTTLLLLLVPDNGGLLLLRPGLAASAGLLACGAAISVVGLWLDLGGTRRSRPMRRLWWPLAALALTGALGSWLALHRVGLEANLQQALASLRLLLLFVALAGTSLLTLAVLGMRALVAVESGPALPVVQLWQATSHTMLGGLGLVALIGFSAEILSRELQVYLATAISVLCAHATLAAAVVLHGSRRALRRLRAAGVGVPLLERAHALASMTLLLGLLLPGLAVLGHLLVSRNVNLIVACCVVAISNHAMRYASVLAPRTAGPQAVPPAAETA